MPRRHFLLSSVMALSLAGCASGVRPEPPPPASRAATEGADQALTDQELAAAYRRDVEDRAWRRHAEVIWIDPPDRHGLRDALRPYDKLRNRTRR